jgi:hypothetical protein
MSIKKTDVKCDFCRCERSKHRYIEGVGLSCPDGSGRYFMEPSKPDAVCQYCMRRRSKHRFIEGVGLACGDGPFVRTIFKELILPTPQATIYIDILCKNCGRERREHGASLRCPDALGYFVGPSKPEPEEIFNEEPTTGLCRTCGKLESLDLMTYISDRYYCAVCKPKNDPVNSPHHYTFGQIEVADALDDWQMNLWRGTVIKYVVRAGRKNPDTEIEDLQKAKWYLEREIQRLNKLSGK